jgi:uncharacterized protein
MKQHLHIITLGVRDLEISRKFYGEVLGWKPANTSNESITFFKAGDVIVALYTRHALAEDAVIAPEGSGFAGFTLAYNAQSESEVDEIINDLRSKGVTIIKEPQKVFWGGYSSYFADPDGFRWEVAYNPFFEFDERGNLKMD